MKFIKHQVKDCKKYMIFHNYTFGKRGEKLNMFNKLFQKIFIVLGFSTMNLMVACSSLSKLPNHLEIGISISDVKRMYQDTNLLYFQNYILFNENEQNIVLKFDDFNLIEQINYISKVDFNNEYFSELKEETKLVDVIKKIGMPTFIGLEQNPSLDFANNENSIYRIYFSKKGDDFVSKERIILNKNDPTSWFDENKSNLPSEEDIKCIKLGMSLEEIVTILGKPQRDIGSGAFLFEFDLSSGKKLEALFVNNDEKENEYIKDHETIAFGSHYLYLVDYSVIDSYH